MSNWRLANSLITLRSQLNGMFPARSKASDGTIGDAAHAARNSQHNPNAAGVVRAFDVTNDESGKGVAGALLLAVLLKHQDSRIRYVIFNKFIYEAKNRFAKTPYHGPNAHQHHLHISVKDDAVHYDDARTWNLDGLTLTEKHSFSVAAREVDESKAANPIAAFQPATDAAGNLPLDAGGENSADKSDGDGKTATETTKSETIATDQGEVKEEETQKNEQSVDEKVLIEPPPPQGISARLKAGIGTLFSGTFIYIVLEKFGAMSFSMQSIVLIAVVCFFALLGFMFWAFMDAWKANNKITHERESRTAIDKKDLEWVETK